jgi:hypothetical protein
MILVERQRGDEGAGISYRLRDRGERKGILYRLRDRGERKGQGYDIG